MPVVICSNLGELTGSGAILLPFLIPFHVNMLNGVIAVGRKNYACGFNRAPKDRRGFVVIFQALFGLDDFKVYWTLIRGVSERGAAGAVGMN